MYTFLFFLIDFNSYFDVLAQFAKLKKSDRYETIEEACGSTSESAKEVLGEASDPAKLKPVSKSSTSNAILVSPKQVL